MYLHNEVLVHQIGVNFLSKVKTALPQIKYVTTKTDKIFVVILLKMYYKYGYRFHFE